MQFGLTLGIIPIILSAKQKIETSGRSRGTAAFLAIVLGGIGAHKFYLGKPGWGIAYFLFSWTFIPACLGFLEGIIYLTMSSKSFEAKYS